MAVERVTVGPNRDVMWLDDLVKDIKGSKARRTRWGYEGRRLITRVYRSFKDLKFC